MNLASLPRPPKDPGLYVAAISSTLTTDSLKRLTVDHTSEKVFNSFRAIFEGFNIKPNLYPKKAYYERNINFRRAFVERSGHKARHDQVLSLLGHD